MKLRFKTILLFSLFIFPLQRSYGRDLIVVRYQAGQSKEQLKNALKRELGIPPAFIKWKSTSLNPCVPVKKNRPLIGICYQDGETKIYSFNKKLYDRTIAKLMKYHDMGLSEAGI